MGFPPTPLLGVSPVFPFNLPEARKTSMTMIFSFALASGICSCKRFLYNILRNSSIQIPQQHKPVFGILLKLTKEGTEKELVISSFGYRKFVLLIDRKMGGEGGCGVLCNR
jgi:hypothetical protein